MSEGRPLVDAPNRGPRKTRQPKPICRTCVRCRAKKVKCDGHRPKCRACTSSSNPCTYPEDARKAGRPSKAEVEALQNEVLIYRRLFKERNGVGQAEDQQREEIDFQNNLSQAGSPPQVPGFVRTPHHNSPRNDPTTIPVAHQVIPRLSHSFSETSSPPQALSFNQTAAPVHTSPRNESSIQVARQTTLSPRSRGYDGGNIPDGPSTAETQIACAIDEDGSIHVHGVTSHLHQPSHSRKDTTDVSLSESEQLHHSQTVKDQLFAFAALQRQRENVVLGQLARGMNVKMELDGLPAELATHLLDLHWNRQHLAYLLTYRPAIFDSLTNDGPYANKLLLNAIYYSSCLYSDRTAIFRSDPDDPLTMGDRFYDRFKELLVQELDRPSLPTIVACLICGATLVSNGKQSAGWVLCGIAYRMVVDLGCHLSIHPQKDRASADSRLTSMEVEIRTRVYWGAFVTDKFQSLYFGRQSALPPSEARVPRTFLDEYEELENWIPYVDPSVPADSSSVSTYQPRPTYAIATFQLHITLAEIAHSIASTFYTIDSIKFDGSEMLRRKEEIQADLDNWAESLPDQLQFDDETDTPPPPNQITPHTTYHTLTILLERPFLSTGHLSSLTDQHSQSMGEARCNQAALRIWRLVDVYKQAHTLRRAPYLISYATYSAIVVLLNQTESEVSQYVNCIRFFWLALLDLQRGCNSGLGKPLKILHALMNRLGQSIPSRDMAAAQSENIPDESFFPNLEAFPHESENRGTGQRLDYSGTDVHGAIPGIDTMFQQSLGNESWEPNSWVDTMLNDQGLMDDSLFGLFTSAQPYI
ncbi:hypothetical protein N431DRAFT_437706 [Stipitochalara longipes BDJ]|nr:hypothetical protein N431DRAFT_437706 [Stipitochalara longipes BDJ]